MTVDDLKRYRSLDDEIDWLNDEISKLKNNQLMDVVKSSNDEFPFTEHTQKICGNSDSVLVKISRKRNEQDKLIALKKEIEDFFDSVSDTQMRKILKLKYIEGKTWAQIARKVGGNNTRDSVRIMSTRFLKKILKK